MERTVTIGIFVILVAVVGWFFLYNPFHSPSDAPIATATYTCDAGKTIKATYYNGPSKSPASPDGPPIPGGKVHIVLSDGRTMDLPQTISADGIRYANDDESFVFWSKGTGAFVLERDQQTFADCTGMQNQ